MSKAYDVKIGDRVRVTRTGVVTSFAQSESVKCFWYRDDRFDGDHYVGYTDFDSADVEVLAPPVVVFTPGQTVRAKGSGVVRSIGVGGCFLHESGAWSPYPFKFTSENFELVNLS